MLLAALLWSLPCISNAAGLDRLVVLSSLGQSFKAEIDLVSGQEDTAALTARIASRDIHRRSDFQYSPILSDLRLNIRRRPGGQAYIEVTSSRLVHEPYIQFMVELQWNSTGIIRGYTAFIDPPNFVHPPVESMPVVAVEAGRVPVRVPASAQRSTTVESPPVTGGGGAAARHRGNDAGGNTGADSAASLSMDWLRMLEEQAAALKLAIAKLNERIALLDKAVIRVQQLLNASPELPAAQAKAKTDTGTGAPNPEPAMAEAAPAAGDTATAKPETPKTVEPAPKPSAPARPEEMKPAAALPPEFSDIIELFDNPIYLAAGGAVILLGVLAVWMRRRNASSGLTSEDLLNKLLARDPDREDVQIKLLEIYAAREDTLRFNVAAARLYASTGGEGEVWRKIAKTGYALDPENPLYGAGKPESVATKPSADDDFYPDAEAGNARS